jgi:hypothetical protein
MVELPLPVIEAGLKLTVTPVGWPVAERLMEESRPPLTVELTVELAELPSATQNWAGEASRLKLAFEGASASIRFAPFGLPHPVARS